MGGFKHNKTPQRINTVALNDSPPPASSLNISFLVLLMIDPLSCTSEGQRSHLVMALNVQDISKRIYAEINV